MMTNLQIIAFSLAGAVAILLITLFIISRIKKSKPKTENSTIQAGQGMADDEKTALNSSDRETAGAAAKGFAHVPGTLAVRLDTFQGTWRDDNQIIQECLKAAEQGDVWACYSLGWMYANGQGVTRDKTVALQWYHKAAEQGHMASQLILGTMYASGHEVPQDDAEAIKWWQMAAGQGNEIAQSHLGRMIAEGRYQPQPDTNKQKTNTDK